MDFGKEINSLEPNDKKGTDSQKSTGLQQGVPVVSHEFAHDLINKLKSNINLALIGQHDIVEMALTCLIAGGHLLIEGVPGLGKTLLVRAIARSFAGDFSRIQFTPDLMPSDVTGHAMYDQKSDNFKIRKGPAFTNLLLADEINRAPAKTQSALLEVMQEKHITIEGRSMPVSSPFMVLATQNPLEQEGTYPLPEAELDRFLMNIKIDYPSVDDEITMVKKITSGVIDDSVMMDELKPVSSAIMIKQLQKIASEVKTDDAILDYAIRLVSATREWPGIDVGASPRASIAIVRAAKSLALVRGCDYVTPEEIKAVGMAVLRHRIVLSTEFEIEGVDVEDVVNELLKKVAVPRE